MCAVYDTLSCDISTGETDIAGVLCINADLKKFVNADIKSAFEELRRYFETL